jgi:hypothetical protein
MTSHFGARSNTLSRSATGIGVKRFGATSSGLPKFGSLEEASTFFEKGALGYSETTRRDHLDGLYLATKDWSMEPLEVLSVHSSYFEDPSLFPPSSVEFDCALLMRNVYHSWRSMPALRLSSARDRALSPIGA